MSDQSRYCPTCHAYAVIPRFHGQGYVCQKCGADYEVLPSPPITRWIFVTISIFFFASFVGLGLPSVIRFILLPQSGSWPTVQGVIQETDIQMQSSARTGAITYIPVARYTYQVHSKTYISNRIRINPWGYATKETAEGEIGSYSPGEIVNVFYFSLIPSYAYLKEGYSTTFLLIEMSIGLFLFAISISSLIIGIRIRNPRFWRQRKTTGSK